MLTKKLLAEINSRPQRGRRELWKFVALGAGVVFLAALLLLSQTLALAILLAGVACVWLLYRREKSGRTTSLVYDLDAEDRHRLAAVQEACEALGSSKRIWLINSGDRTSKPDTNAAAPASDRQRVEVGRLETPGISTNVAIWGIGAGEGLKVFFFPDAVLLYREGRYRAVPYKSLKVYLSSTRFFEEEEVPEDAEVVAHTWRHTTADGKPDRRYNPNPRLPVVLYGLLRITASPGLDLSLQVSNRAAAARFARAFGARRRKRAREEEPRTAASESDGQGGSRPSTEEEKAEAAAREVLGVADGASMGEITTAYRKLALTYHPDKVAHLAPEVREFADQKMKEINAAYAQLKRQVRVHPTAFSAGGEPGNGKEG